MNVLGAFYEALRGQGWDPPEALGAPKPPVVSEDRCVCGHALDSHGVDAEGFTPCGECGCSYTETVFPYWCVEEAS